MKNLIKKNKLLLEIYIENLPENIIYKLYNLFLKSFKKELYKNFLHFNNIEKILTNKRIGFIINDIYAEKITKKNIGPNIYLVKNNIFINIINKWIKKHKLKINYIKYLINDNGIFIYYYKKNISKLYIKNILINSIKYSLNLILNKFNIMRWDIENKYFVRPIRNILLLFNDNKVKFNILNLKSNNITYGNDYSNKKLIINNINSYKNILKYNNVITSLSKRKKIINKFLIKIKKKFNSKIILNNRIINKYYFISEKPVMVYIKINKKLIKYQKILIKIMYIYYDFLLIKNENNKLLPYLLFLSNSKKNTKFLIYNYKIFIENLLKRINFLIFLDLKHPLYKNFNKLKYIIFRKKLGNIYNKLLRIKKLSLYISKIIKIDYINEINILIPLYKSDLISNIVKEFPMLQGYFGMYHSIKNKIDKNISLCINNQYNNFLIKNNKLSNIINLSDKIDSVIGNLYISYFLKNSNKLSLDNDPYFIKRDIYLIIIILINTKNLCFLEIIKKSIKIYSFNKNTFFNFIKNVFIKRINLFFLSKSYKSNIINTILYKNYYLYDINLILKSIKNYKNFNFIVKIFRRIYNLIKKDIKHKIFYKNFTNLDKKFYKILLVTKKNIKKNINIKNYNNVLNILFTLSKFINNLLNKVYIKNNNNLIFLLNKSLKLFLYIIDISILN